MIHMRLCMVYMNLCTICKVFVYTSWNVLYYSYYDLYDSWIKKNIIWIIYRWPGPPDQPRGPSWPRHHPPPTCGYDVVKLWINLVIIICNIRCIICTWWCWWRCYSELCRWTIVIYIFGITIEFRIETLMWVWVFVWVCCKSWICVNMFMWSWLYFIWCYIWSIWCPLWYVKRLYMISL
jgi:hypothetical protein